MINADAFTPRVGVVGVGVMGGSLVAALLARGCDVVGFSIDAAERHTLRQRVESEWAEAGIGAPAAQLTVSGEYSALHDCEFIIETIIENLAAKRAVLAQIEEHCAASAIIGSNTSALPITLLQREMRHPERLVGTHFGLPVTTSPFCEIMPGEATAEAVAQRAWQWARAWGKEAVLLKRDLRGFIANRLGYAMLREAFAIVESGAATPAEVDAAARYSIGTWLPLAGPFRHLDLFGPAAYANVMRDLLPDLSNSTTVPRLMEETVASGAQGVKNARGFYEYSARDAARREEVFTEFWHEIIELIAKYDRKAEGEA